ncbi:MAG: SurA N-terminal domain-containing protein, partial [Hyphomicrobiaceae bacterium]
PKAQRAPRRKHGVAILVNDEPITHHEIDQRARLMMVQANVSKTARAKFQSLVKQKSVNNQLRSLLKETIDANPGKSREQILAKFERKKKAFAASLRARALSSARSGLLPQFRKKAKKQLIEERLKMQEAKRLKTLASWKDVDGAIANIAKRNKVDVKTFLGRLGTGGARSTTFKNKIRADMSWSGVVRRRYGHTIAVSLADIDRHANTASGESGTKLKLHQIVVPLPKKIDQSAVAARLRDAETLQASFRGCATTQKVAKRISGAVFKDLGAVKPDTIPEPTRSLLLQAKDGEISPPTITSKGVVLYAVCSRTSGGSVKDTARTKARQALRQREFEIMGRRHLADLQRDAHIEYR